MESRETNIGGITVQMSDHGITFMEPGMPLVNQTEATRNRTLGWVRPDKVLVPIRALTDCLNGGWEVFSQIPSRRSAQEKPCAPKVAERLAAAYLSISSRAGWR